MTLIAEIRTLGSHDNRGMDEDGRVRDCKMKYYILALVCFWPSNHSPFTAFYFRPTMQRSLPDDILVCIAVYLSDDELQALLAVHPAFYHLAMVARYASVLLSPDRCRLG